MPKTPKNVQDVLLTLGDVVSSLQIQHGMTERQAEAYALSLHGFTLRDIAAGVGRKHQNVERSIKDAKMKLPSAQHWATPQGNETGKRTVQFDADGNVEREWIRFHPEVQQAENVCQAVADGVTREVTIPKPRVTKKADKLAVFPLPDLHNSMRAWEAETGTNWDTDIAIGHYRRSFTDLLEQTGEVGAISLHQLGDYFHMNDKTYATPKSKHRLDVDSRALKTLEAGADLMEWMLTEAAKVAPVQLINLRGNHDIDMAQAMGLVLKKVFRNTKHVDIHNHPQKHYTYKWGRCGFWLTHGDTGKPDRWMQKFTTTKVWCDTTYRYIHSGHLHNHKIISYAGCKLEQFNAPIPEDSYAHEECWAQLRQEMVAIQFDKNLGEISRRYHVIIPD